MTEIKGLLLRYKETQFGFEGMTSEAAKLRKRDGIVLEKASIEDMMLYFEKEEAVC